jgi:hypothetical protein
MVHVARCRSANVTPRTPPLARLKSDAMSQCMVQPRQTTVERFGAAAEADPNVSGQAEELARRHDDPVLSPKPVGQPASVGDADDFWETHAASRRDITGQKSVLDHRLNMSPSDSARHEPCRTVAKLA